VVQISLGAKREEQVTDYILCCERYNQKHSIFAIWLAAVFPWEFCGLPPDVRKGSALPKALL
jgi:hypothetical protein